MGVEEARVDISRGRLIRIGLAASAVVVVVGTMSMVASTREFDVIETKRSASPPSGDDPVTVTHASRTERAPALPLPPDEPAVLLPGTQASVLAPRDLSDSMGNGGGSAGRHGGPRGGRRNLHARGGDAPPPALPPASPFRAAEGDGALSTFAIDVDTASYTFVRRFLRHEQLPPPEMVRVEELVNGFQLADPAPPTDGRAFAAAIEVATCPWRPANRLVRVSLRGREVDESRRPTTNLVFLIDVSGSMSAPQRLPLLKQGLRLLVDRLGEKDRVAIVVYAGAAGLVLPPTCGAERGKIVDALERLEAGGSTNGGAGIQLAYDTAVAGFVEGGINRVVLCTDGDFNVGLSEPGALEAFIDAKKRSGVLLTCLGFGVAGGGDSRLEALADQGDGNYAAIDDLREARRVLVEEVGGTLVTIARDVKVQVAFEPARVRTWRLLGYENRLLASADFADDTKDAGELGAGHRVTALYEVEPTAAPAAPAARLLTLRLRWKGPEAGSTASDLLELEAPDAETTFGAASPDLRFVASVVAGGMLLRKQTDAGEATFARAAAWARAAIGNDPRGERAEWIELLGHAARLSGSPLEPSKDVTDEPPPATERRDG